MSFNTGSWVLVLVLWAGLRLGAALLALLGWGWAWTALGINSSRCPLPTAAHLPHVSIPPPYSWTFLRRHALVTTTTTTITTTHAEPRLKATRFHRCHCALSFAPSHATVGHSLVTRRQDEWRSGVQAAVAEDLRKAQDQARKQGWYSCARRASPDPCRDPPANSHSHRSASTAAKRTQPGPRSLLVSTSASTARLTTATSVSTSPSFARPTSTVSSHATEPKNVSCLLSEPEPALILCSFRMAMGPAPHNEGWWQRVGYQVLPVQRRHSCA